MTNTAWIALIRRVPVIYHQKLSIVTLAGTEIALSCVVRMEEDYMLIRGRLSGTTETGRAFFVPYDQLNYVSFQQPISEAELLAMYGESADALAVDLKIAADIPETAEDVPAAPPNQTPLPELAKGSVKSAGLGKNSILERLRARSNVGNQFRPPTGK